MSKQEVCVDLCKVFCMDETGGANVERVGNDEIWLSAVGLDATGKAVKCDPFEIYAHFDDREEKKYDPPRTLLTLDVPNSGAFPKTITASFILAEHADGAGHREVTQKAFTKLAEVAQAEKQRMMSSGVSPENVSSGDIWEKAKTALSDYVQGLIESGIKDNVFPQQDVFLDITSADFRFDDGTKWSPELTVVCSRHQGKYYITYAYEVRPAQ